MTRLRLWDRGAQRLATVDAYQFPGSVRQRFALEHDALSSDEIATVEAATRQWFRLAARHPKAKLSMPSVVVDDLWHEFVLHTRDYATFCDTAFGRFLHHTPESAMTPAGASANRHGALAATFRLAVADEHLGPGLLPLLFRVDAAVGAPHGRRYLADCGGRGVCYDLKGTLCLQHLGGPGSATRRFGTGRPPDSATGFPPSAGCGGCGSGCGGGS
jgi:hypothetical protein